MLKGLAFRIGYWLFDKRWEFAIMAALTFLTLGLEGMGWLNVFKGVDVLLHAQPARPSDKIVIVEIKDADYANIFNSVSPLPPKEVLELIRRVGDAAPKAIGIDLDTTSPSYSTTELPAHFPDKVVWAQVPAIPAIDENEKPWYVVAGEFFKAMFVEPEGEPDLTLQPVRGGREKLLDMGIPLFPFDPDGQVRRYPRKLKVKPGGGLTPEGETMASLASAVLEHAGEHVPDDDETVLFDFAGNRHSFPIFSAGAFLRCTNAEVRTRDQDCNYDSAPVPQPLKDRLKDKIVLIGGNYGAARDEYLTPMGPMAGVELIAQAMQSDLTGGGIREMRKWVAIVCDLIAGTIIVLLFEFIPFTWAFAGSVVMMIAAFVGGMFNVHAGAYLLNFVPVVFGVFLHQVYEAGKAAGKHEAELEESKTELAEAYEKISGLERQLAQTQDSLEPGP